jgi:Zn-dependent protease with chaperone function
MRSIGADIRIVNIPKNEVSELIKGFIYSNDLVIEKDEIVNNDVKNIRAVNPMDSYLKFWWTGTPQVIDWKIFESKEGEAKIETRFGFQKRYWLWYWGLLSALVFLFSVSYEIGLSFSLTNNPDELARSINLIFLCFIIAGVLAIVILGFIVRSIQDSYDHFLDSIKNTLSQTDRTYLQNQIQSNQSPPHIFQVLIFTITAVSIFCFMYGGQFLKHATSLKLFFLVLVLSVLFVLLLVAFFCTRITHFPQRLMFTSLGVVITIPIMIFYSLPYLNAYTGNLAERYDGYKRIESLFNKNPGDLNLERRVSITNQALRGYFLFAAISNVLIISIAGLLIIHTPRVTRAIKNWKRDFFSDKKWILYHKGVIDFSGYSKRFSFAIFTLWIAVSITLYIVIYPIFCVVEFGIVGKNIFFMIDACETLCNDTTTITGYFLSPLVNNSFSKLFSRIILLLYTLPLLWIIFTVLKKRMNAYVKSLEERRRFLLKSDKDTFNLYGLCKKICDRFDATIPKIVLIPSKIPMVTTKFIGMPYFRSYIIISEGCLNLKESELMGLLAHEIYHTKRHTFKWYLLNLLSDYTFFGTGFLAVTTNSYAHELEADYHAALWIKERGSIDDFINSLRIISGVGSEGGLGFSAASVNSESTEQTSEAESIFKKLKQHIETLSELYFGDEILSYIHPPLEERIERIRAIGLKKG